MEFVGGIMMPRNIGVIGNLEVDLIFRGINNLPGWGEEIIATSREAKAAGSAGYTAYTLGNFDCNPLVFGPIGNDNEGRFIKDQLDIASINMKHIKIYEDEPTGLSVTFISDEDGERSFVNSIGCLKKYGWDELQPHLETLKELDLVLIAGYFLMPGLRGCTTRRLFETLRVNGTNTALDIGHPPKGWRSVIIKELKPILSLTDYFFPNEDELVGLTDTENHELGCNVLQDWGVKNILLKLGKQGSKYFGHNNKIIAKAVDVNVTDTVGAGDVFNAGFLAGWRNDLSLSESLQLATATSAKFISSNQKKFPTFHEVKETSKKVKIHGDINE